MFKFDGDSSYKAIKSKLELKQQQIQAMLYLFAEKFITDMDRLLKVKKIFAMTALGQMLAEDKAIEIATNLLKKFFDPQIVAKTTG